MGRCFLVQGASCHLQLEVVIKDLLYGLTDMEWIKHLHIWHTIERKVRLVFHRVFQPSEHAPLDFEATVEATLLDLQCRFRVRKVLFDPSRDIPRRSSKSEA